MRLKLPFFLRRAAGFSAGAWALVSLLLTPAEGNKLEAFFSKKNVTIVVTDSGLGGLSIMAEAVRKMEEERVFLQADFIFANALFSSEGGYNSLRTKREKVRVFNSALQSIARTFHPDLLLIACNTLSTLYDDTEFSRRASLPVIGILDAAANLIAQALKEAPASSLLLFATPTTVAEDAYRKRLASLGVDPNRVVYQPCPELEIYIEKNPEGEETALLIAGYVREALDKLPSPTTPFLVSLNCTHYGYSLDAWKAAFADGNRIPEALFNPNARMLDFLFSPDRKNRYPASSVTARVVSLVEIEEEKIDSLARWLKEVSPRTAEALRRYEIRPGLFEWRKFVNRSSGN